MIEQTTALYYRVANNKQSDGLNTDSQMQKLLCYAQERGLNSFTLYVDSGTSGLTLDRPSLNALKADIETGRVNKVVVCDVARVARDFLLMWDFIAWVETQGAGIVSIAEGDITASMFGDFTAVFRSILNVEHAE
ncbi:MAG: recombinase family protein [Oscillospiraceae bacterium]|jgi:DNA invertase Pin-like site-specific DNA recombinase|nr:recombinase family protein [Oscillospiraceae bacterium]